MLSTELLYPARAEELLKWQLDLNGTLKHSLETQNTDVEWHYDPFLTAWQVTVSLKVQLKLIPHHSSAQPVFCCVALRRGVMSVHWGSENAQGGNAFTHELANTPTRWGSPGSHSINPCLGVCFSCLGPGWLPPHWGLCKVMETLREGGGHRWEEESIRM